MADVCEKVCDACGERFKMEGTVWYCVREIGIEINTPLGEREINFGKYKGHTMPIDFCSVECLLKTITAKIKEADDKLNSEIKEKVIKSV